MMEIYIVEDKWKGSLGSKKYGLSIQNAKHALTKLDMQYFLRGKIPRQDTQHHDNFHLICLGQRETDTYAKEIQKQKDPQTNKLVITPPAIWGWRSK